eukprot:INCI20213.3.p3 GENE.INCI20213.3~~INCI20213.3.p3  ORF type:complete len:198 (-),score=39.71 INCI20213.3:1581-2174(-)
MTVACDVVDVVVVGDVVDVVADVVGAAVAAAADEGGIDDRNDNDDDVVDTRPNGLLVFMFELTTVGLAACSPASQARRRDMTAKCCAFSVCKVHSTSVGIFDAKGDPAPAPAQVPASALAAAAAPAPIVKPGQQVEFEASLLLGLRLREGALEQENDTICRATSVSPAAKTASTTPRPQPHVPTCLPWLVARINEWL